MEQNRQPRSASLPFSQSSLLYRYISPTNPQFSTHRSSCATSTDQPEIPPKMSSENKQQVTLRASDDGTYTVERVVAEKSGLINQMIEGESSTALWLLDELGAEVELNVYVWLRRRNHQIRVELGRE